MTASLTFAAGRETGWALSPLLKIITIAFILPLCPAVLWYFGTGSALHFRGWINIEYLVLVCVALLRPAWWTVALLTVELVVSLIEPIAHFYYYSPADAVLSLRYLHLLPVPRLAGYLVVLVLYAAGNAIVLRRMIGRERSASTRMVAIALVCVASMLFTVNLARNHDQVPHCLRRNDPDTQRRPLSQMPVVSLLKGMMWERPGARHTERVPLASALWQGYAELDRNGKPDIVEVVTESWGKSKDPRVEAAQIEPYLRPEILDRYHVELGSVAFSGGTTSGETRELCGDSRGRTGSGDLTQCWPTGLERDGYRTLAVHGYTPMMFRRKEWYRQFGFDESDFLPELVRDGARQCDGAFLGACDGDVARWIEGRLASGRSGRPVFVHWVTLNSHLPVAAMDGAGYAQRCNVLSLSPGTSLCSWFNHVMVVEESVADLALRVRRPTMFVVVGDHAPPFLESADRNRFSQTEVPYILLVPKEAMAARAVLSAEMRNRLGAPTP